MNHRCLHILNRFGFGNSIKFLQRGELIDLLIDENKLKFWLINEVPEFVEIEKVNKEFSTGAKIGSNEKWRKRWPDAAVRTDWIQFMVELDNPLREKAALFWNHVVPISVGIWGFAQNLLIDSYRKNAFEDYNVLLKDVLASPCAMKFLNAYHSRKDSPNQNMPRELLELFTVGIDNYSQDDVLEISRAFAGRRTVNPDNFKLPYPYQMYIDENNEDRGKKNILGQTGNWDGNDAIDILVNSKHTHDRIAQLFIRFFVSDKPKDEHVDELAAFTFSKNRINFIDLVQYTINSDWFFRDEYIGNKVKTPVEHWVGFQKKIGLKVLTSELHSNVLRQFGQDVFFPINVGGWPWGEGWLNGNLLINRVFLPKAILEIAQENQQEIEMSFSEKVTYRTFKKHLLGMRFESAVLLNIREVIHILKENNVKLSSWVLSRNTSLKNDEISYLITHQLFQYH
jgi:uncharacterized protein (DUF1800 family)